MTAHRAEHDTQGRSDMPSVGKYLYALVEDSTPPSGLTGVDGATVTTIAAGSVAAVVSDCAAGRLRPERRKLAAHFDVLKALMKDRTILPMAFGLVADDDKQVRAILTQNRSTFAAQLRRFQGKVEMDLKLTWDVPNIFEFFVATQPELRAMRDKVFAHGRPTQDRMMDLGRFFESTLDEVRMIHRIALLRAITPNVAEVKELKPKAESEIVNLAILVESGSRTQFEAGVNVAAGAFGEDIVFELTGPFPPHNFVEMRLAFDSPDEE